MAFDPDTQLLFGISREDFSTNPITRWNLGSFDPSTGTVNIFGPNQTARRFDALAFAVETVPLPAALPLFGTGLAILGFVGWRRKRAAAA